MIEAIELTSTRRSRGGGGGPVEKVSFDVYPGQVTALLGAHGSGKSTVLRMMVELEPGGGRTLFGGRPYHALRPAVREVGLALNPDAVHPGRTVQAHLQLYVAGGGVPKGRIAEVLEVAGLSTQATVRCGRLDPGQRQRLAIAAALLGDPSALILDEPQALDAHGMSWFHALIRAYAAQGRTVLVAATDLDSLSGTADHVVVLRRGEEDGVSRVTASRSAADVFDERRATVVQVRSPQAARLAAALEVEGARLASAGPGALQVRGLDRARIGEVAHVAGVCLHELSEIGHDDVFGLRPVPRQKEILSGLNRIETQDTASTWHSGVRLVSAGEIEQAQVVETAEESTADAMTEQPATQAADTAMLDAATATTAGGGTQAVSPPAPSANTPVEAGGASASASIAGTDLPVTTLDAQAVPAAAPTVGMQATRSTVSEAQVEAPTAAPGADAQTAVVSQAGPDPSATPREAAIPADQTPAYEPASSESADSAALSQTTVSLRAESLTSLTPVAEVPAPKQATTTPRRNAFALRWGRSKPSASQAPAVAPPPAAPTQPAVPFTVVASQPAGQPSEPDGMTPWRAVAARATHQSQQQSQQSQQQASAAGAAPAEQETSA